MNALADIFNYGLLTISTVMFGMMFFFNDMYRKNYGSGLQATLINNAGAGVFGLISLLVLNGFVFEFSWFALIMSLISALNGLAFSYCSLKALGKINLSLYSLFSMLGGMVLPFVYGIIFSANAFTLGKAVCFVFITVALLFTIEKGEKGTGTIYYIGVFIFNGMSGVIAAVFSAINGSDSLAIGKVSAAGFSILKAIVSILLALLILLFIKKDGRKLNLKSVIAMAGGGSLGNIANWILLIPLSASVISFGAITLGGLHASAQYPFITGGTMIVSTVISLFTKKKPSAKEMIAVLLAFIGVVLLVALPETELFTIKW